MTLSAAYGKILYMTKDVRIKIVSEVFDLQRGDDTAEYEGVGCRAEGQRFEISCRGSLEQTDGVLTLRYDEPGDSQMGKTCTTLSFPLDAPGTVTLRREGAVNSVFVYDESVGRRVYLYETPVMPLEMGIVTKRLDNRMTESGGSIHIDYKIDICISNAERTVIDITAAEV